MLKSEVLDFRTKTIYNVSYFEDDTIDTVRNTIASAMNTHPDRLFILVSLNFNNDYYQKDPRRWEDLFDRMSYGGTKVLKEAFQEYQLQYRSPQTDIAFGSYDRTEWMMKPDSLAEFHSPTRDFYELRIFGVEDVKSYVLPLEFNPALVSKIPAAKLPQPLITTLVSTLYDSSQIAKFVVIPYDASAENAQLVYFPFLRSTTPNFLSEESVAILEKNKKLLSDLLAYKVYQPRSLNIRYARFHTKFVETDFGNAVRTRFEQIFYGMTLSEEVPYIGFFTGKGEDMRHKFYVDNPKKGKIPFLDMGIWKRWDSRRPPRNIPTLILYRGSAKDVYDRIAITELDITMTFYRDETSSQDLEKFKKEGLEWLKQFDALSSFINKNDIDSQRWKVQELELHLNYYNILEKIDDRRMNCISFLFTQPDPKEAKFNFLRTDRTNYGISPVEVKVLQMMRDGDIKPTVLAQELSISVEKAKLIIQDVQNKLDTDPNIEDRAFRNYPSVEIQEKKIVVKFVAEIGRIVKYASLLRYIVGMNDSKLDAICPKRMETVKIDVGTAPKESVEVDEQTKQQFGDLFGFLEEDEQEAAIPVEKTEEKKSRQLALAKTERSKYSYFNERLKKFDPATFEPNVEDFQYTKKCEYKKQPIILSQKDLDAIDGEYYDPRTYLPESKMLETKEPDGLIVCPEYWCMHDQIVLTEDQLEKEDGELKCPVCGRKLRVTDTEDPREYSVIQRKEGFVYPHFSDYESPKNKRLTPCCLKTARKEKAGDDVPDKYYVNRENIVGLKELRLAFLSKDLIKSLQINETYELLLGPVKRLNNGMSGFFRIGIGRPSETIPEILDLKTKIPSPLESVETILKCSFLRTWKRPNNSHLQEIDNALKKIPPYTSDETVRSNLAHIISGIHSAYQKKELSILEELEYVCLFLQCDIFRIHTNANTLGCIFYSPIVRPRSRGIVILQTEKSIDLLCHVTRLPRGFQYKGNVFESPFKKETYVILEKLRTKACNTKMPSLSTALTIARDVLAMSGKDDFQVILDPFGRGQSFFIPNHMFIPFQPSIVPDMSQPKILGYSNVPTESFPPHNKVLEYLEIAKTYNEGYKFEEDLYNSDGNRVEVLLESGLRIPVLPERGAPKESLEVIDTTNQVGESQLVFGKESTELVRDYKNTSYASEIYEFLLYELTFDLQEDELKLRRALSEDYPKQSQVEPLLQKWFEAKVEMTQATKPIQFVSKIRKPCGQFKSENTCGGNLCAWDGKTCKVEVKNTVRKDNLFHRILTTLLENSKIRDMILDGRTTPFFSTVLYLEMPNELIATDLDIVDILV
jgi:hypothetical protein